MKTKTQQVMAGVVGLAYSLLTAALALLCTEWIQRGTLENLWVKYIQYHEEAFLAAGILLWLVYGLVFSLTQHRAGHTPIPAPLRHREPEGHIDQHGEDQKGHRHGILHGQTRCAGHIGGLAHLCQIPRKKGLAAQLQLKKGNGCGNASHAPCHQHGQTVLFAAAAAALIGGVFLDSERSQSELRVTPDMWNQARYYRNYGVITAFLTNIQTLQIQQPANYSANSIAELVQTTQKKAKFRKNLFEGSYGSQSKDQQTVSQPDILYIMDESFWDAAELEAYGVKFDRELTPNLTRLRGQAAYGKAYSPSFGGGTCDVEFEALTGYSKEFLPAGSKPYQQHITSHMQSLPNYLKTTQGYQTAAIHGYYKRFWSRITAYPNLGLDRFVGLEDMQDPEKKRYEIWKNGLVTDAEMARQIEALYEQMLAENDAPVFLHAVTMQNHTSYTKNNYDDESRVKVLSAPDGIDEETLGALEDFATGVWEADAMLGQLTDYYQKSDRPAILVFWGDHYNPIGSNLSVYTATGYASNDSQDPALHGMPLLIWSNYWQQPVEFGTVGAYEIGPVVSELYGLDRPDFFEYLTQQMQTAYRSRTLGVTIETDGTPTKNDLSDAQQVWFGNHWLWQYDLMFGKEYSLGDAAYRSANQSAAR